MTRMSPPGDSFPSIDLGSMRVVLDYGSRTRETEPVIRTYTVRVAVPREHPRWHIPLGDDYEVLIATRGFRTDSKGVTIDGRVKSNYQVQLNDDRAPVGPNSVGFCSGRR